MNEKRYGIAVKANYYQPELQGRDHAKWITESDNDYWQAPKLFDTIQDAEEYIAAELIGDGPYVLDHGEAGRPDYWVVSEDAIDTVMSCHADNGNYSWPDDCDSWECCDSDGNVCGCCQQCIEYMANQDAAVLKAGKVDA